MVAAVVPRAGAGESAESLIEWSAERLAGYKRPREIVFLAPEEMPRNATGKILHRTLREMFDDGAGTTSGAT